jgi:G:T-mismatch repair DNA endonuclease (very short patch repair protein)
VIPYPASIRDRVLLHSLYIEQRLSSREIGAMLGINDRLVRTWLKNFGIATRSHKEAGAISAAKYLSKKVLRVCPICPREFEVHLYRTKRAKVLYCSRECLIKDPHSSLNKALEVRRRQHPRVSKTCPVCETLFTVPFSHGRRKYCSDQCKGVAHMAAMARRKEPTMPEQRIKAILDRHFPEFKYNGNANLGVVLGSMIPDFVNTNGKKQVIEVFGDYYHGKLCSTWKNSELGKKMAYNFIGYRCLVLWEHETKTKTEAELVNIISHFSNTK